MPTPVLFTLPADLINAIVADTEKQIPDIIRAGEAQHVAMYRDPPIETRIKAALSDSTLHHEMQVTEALARVADESPELSKYDAQKKYEAMKLVSAVSDAIQQTGPVDKETYETLMKAVFTEMKKKVFKASTAEDKITVDALTKETREYNRAHLHNVSGGENVTEHGSTPTTPGGGTSKTIRINK